MNLIHLNSEEYFSTCTLVGHNLHGQTESEFIRVQWIYEQGKAIPSDIKEISIHLSGIQWFKCI